MGHARGNAQELWGVLQGGTTISPSLRDNSVI
jgi:hypothetical protein